MSLTVRQRRILRRELRSAAPQSAYMLALVVVVILFNDGKDHPTASLVFWSSLVIYVLTHLAWITYCVRKSR